MDYYGPLKIGSDSSSMQFNFDTGSDWLWIPITGCSKCPGVNTHTTGAPDTSSGLTGSISYGDGSKVDGNIYTTSVTIGTMTVTNITSLMVSTYTPMTGSTGDTTAYDGICGLSYGLVSTGA